MSSKDYRAIKGRAAVPAEHGHARKPSPELSASEKERVAENRRLVIKHAPELVPVIKELHEAGMIDGWRAVIEVIVTEEGSHATLE